METKFDVIVIGGGPAGMMASSEASSRGRSVLLLEKNNILGKKLSITGGGRCNVTNNKQVVRDILSQYKDSGKFLFSTFMQHGVVDTIQWFEDRGVELVEENEGRLFPASNKAETICKVMRDEVKEKGVIVMNNVSVISVKFNSKKETFIVQTSLGNYESEACIVASGGKSHPETGSTGECFDWLKSLGHNVSPCNMALVPVVVNEAWIDSLSGVTLPDVKITVFLDNVKKSVCKGKILFTHVGLSGPSILNLSKSIGELLATGSVVIKLDFMDALDSGELKLKMLELIRESSNKKIKNIVSELVPTSIGAVMLKILGIDGDKYGHSLTRVERVRLLEILKALPLPISSLLGEDKAIVSDGGVFLEEINFKTMESKLIPKLYLVGDVLNINRPSGGYSLQICWSTGYVAGTHA